MKYVIVQVSPSYRQLLCGIISILTITVLAPIIDLNSERGYVEVNFGLALLSPTVICVCAREIMPNMRFLFCYCNTTLGGRQCIVDFE